MQSQLFKKMCFRITLHLSWKRCKPAGLYLTIYSPNLRNQLHIQQAWMLWLFIIYCLKPDSKLYKTSHLTFWCLTQLGCLSDTHDYSCVLPADQCFITFFYTLFSSDPMSARFSKSWGPRRSTSALVVIGTERPSAERKRKCCFMFP